jgi:hypothetical protein
LRANWPVAVFRHQYWLAADYGGDCVLEDELFLVIVFQQNGILIEGSYASRQFDAAHQVNRNLRFIFANSVQKSVLNILCCLAFHFSSPCVTTSGSKHVAQSGRTVTHLQVLQPYRFILPNGGRNCTVPVLSMNLSNIARRQSNTAPNMAGNLDAELWTSVSWIAAVCALFIRVKFGCTV